MKAIAFYSPWEDYVEKPLSLAVSRIAKSIFNLDFQPIFVQPPNDNLGDLSVRMFEPAKALNISPVEITKIIAKEFKPFCSITGCSPIGPYLNFHVSTVELAKKTLPVVIDLGERYGDSSAEEGTKVIVEHTSANPLHPLHIGHARNAFIGDAIANIYECLGYEVERHYYLNDMGRQVAILVVGIENLGINEYPSDFKEDHFIGQIYVQANRLAETEDRLQALKFERSVAKLLGDMERGEPNIVQRFENIVDYCLKGQLKTLDALGVRFQHFLKESWLCHTGRVADLVNELTKSKYYKKLEDTEYYQKGLYNKNACEEEDSLDPESYVLDLSSFGVNKPLYLTRSDGTTLYTTRDIAYSVWKLERNPEMIFNVIASEQILSQTQMRKALEILGVKDVDKKLVHLAYEIVLTPQFGSMSGRRGQFISLDYVIEVLKDEAYKRIKSDNLTESEKSEIAKAVATASLKFSMLKVHPMKVINFNLTEALNLKSSSGPYLLYTVVRAKSILRKSNAWKDADYKCLEGAYEKNCIKNIAKFPTIIRRAAEQRAPNILAQHLLELADNFNIFYETKPILKSTEDEQAKAARLHLVKAVETVLVKGLRLLGIRCAEKM